MPAALIFTTMVLGLWTTPVVLSNEDAQENVPLPEEKAWRYVVPPGGDPFEHAPFRAIAMSRAKPEDLSEKAQYRGERTLRRYAQIRYGSPGSIRVTVVLDERADGRVDLYLDADRNRKIDDRDLAIAERSTKPGEATLWRVPLAVAMVDHEITRLIPRAVVFRSGKIPGSLSYATAGYLEGTLQTTRRVAARRVDGNGNGLMSDPQDRLWIDQNGDGRFDPVIEQMLYTTTLNLGQDRYVVRSDELGERLKLEPLAGVGGLRLAISDHDSAVKTPSRITTLQATAIARDGSAYVLMNQEATIVPVGEYRLGTVMISLTASPAGGEVWSFVFSADGQGLEPRWYKVEPNAQVAIDPIGILRFELQLTDQPGAVKAASNLNLQPLLFTGDGLLINVAYKGDPVAPAAQEILTARISLIGSDLRPIAESGSGFT